MAVVDLDDVRRMTDAVYIDGSLTGRKATKFWSLLILAAVIASAGLIGDGVATVIGAMIVAPLMTPILGTALGIVLGDARMSLRSMAYVVVGAAVVIGLAALLGAVVGDPAGYVGNAQIEARISPRLIDLVAALATGTVGAFALVRRDVSDTLPGVAIAISLVPPLAVVGILASAGRWSDAGQALLLFATNVAAIVLTGVLVLLAYRIRPVARDAGATVGAVSPLSIVAVVVAVVAIALPLAAGSASLARDRADLVAARPVVQEWAGIRGWVVRDVSVTGGVLSVEAIGPAPEPTGELLRSLLDNAGLAGLDLELDLVVGSRRDLPGTG